MAHTERTAPEPLEEQTDLGGMFYPVGHMLVALNNEGDARKVQDDLERSGFAAADCRHYTSEEMASLAGKKLNRNSGFLATLGKSDEIVQRMLDAAKDGAAFLLIHAPHDDEAARAMESVRRVPFRFVHRYHSLAIEEMK
jgi:hypothetical protein